MTARLSPAKKTTSEKKPPLRRNLHMRSSVLMVHPIILNPISVSLPRDLSLWSSALKMRAKSISKVVHHEPWSSSKHVKGLKKREEKGRWIINENRRILAMLLRGRYHKFQARQSWRQNGEGLKSEHRITWYFIVVGSPTLPSKTGQLYGPEGNKIDLLYYCSIAKK